MILGSAAATAVTAADITLAAAKFHQTVVDKYNEKNSMEKQSGREQEKTRKPAREKEKN